MNQHIPENADASASNAWNFNFNNANVNNNNVDNNNRVRCFRPGAHEKKHCLALKPALTLSNESPSLEEIYQAYLRCRKNKRYKRSSLNFEKNLWQNLILLEELIKTNQYQASKAFVFSVKKPKPREIIAARFIDRVAHHLLVSSLEKKIEADFYPLSVACRKEKGNRLAIETLNQIIKEKGAEKLYFLKLDIANFFPSIKRESLMNLLKPYFTHNWQKDLAEAIIFQDFSKADLLKSHEDYLNQLSKNRCLRLIDQDYGLPIGNLTSQFWANLYLNELDHLLANFKSVYKYIRFVDDFLMISSDPLALVKIRGFSINYLNQYRDLKLKHPAAQVLPLKYGLNFLGYKFRPKYKTVKKSVKKRIEARLKSFAFSEKRKTFANYHLIELSHETRTKICCSLSSSMAHFKDSSSIAYLKTLISENPFLKFWFYIDAFSLKDRFILYKEAHKKQKEQGTLKYFIDHILKKNSDFEILLKAENGSFLFGKLAQIAKQLGLAKKGLLNIKDLQNVFVSKNLLNRVLDCFFQRNSFQKIAMIEKKHLAYKPFKNYQISQILVGVNQ